ncbi:MAG: hypothetical protein M3421_16075 [Bacteroidota bacterium]|jgi:hypothetical protein|nr:hypothetical protein [Bacteroidota bacterium]
MIEWLENSDLATAIRQDIWLYPILEIIHIIGFVFLVGAAIMFDLRLLGFSKNISITSLSKHLLPWSQASFFIVVPSGLLLFITNAVSMSNNNIFWIKLSLIILAGLNALLFHLTVFRTVANWDINCATPASAKYIAIASILLWLTVIACGRLLAY